jgi:hypothetical protein
MATLPGLGTLDQPLRGAITAAAKEALNMTGGSTASRASGTAPVVPANAGTQGGAPGGRPPLPSSSSARLTPQQSMLHGLNDTLGSRAGGAGGYSVSASRALSTATSVMGRGSVTSMEDLESDLDDLVESLGLGGRQKSETAPSQRLPATGTVNQGGGYGAMSGSGGGGSGGSSAPHPAVRPSPSLPRSASQRQQADADDGNDDVLELGPRTGKTGTSTSGVSVPPAFSFGQGLKVQAQAVVRSSLSGAGQHQQQHLSNLGGGAEPDSLEFDLEGLDPAAGGSATAKGWTGSSGSTGRGLGTTALPPGSGAPSTKAASAVSQRQQHQSGSRLLTKHPSTRVYEEYDFDVDDVLEL